MDRTHDSLDSRLRAAADWRGAARLLAALGFDAPAGPVVLPPGARAAWGLDAAEGVRRAVDAGERGGLGALLLEVEDDGPHAVARLARAVRSRSAARPWLYVFAPADYARLTFASFGLDGELRRLALDRARPRRSDLEVLDELAARDGEGGVALALRHARALDRSRVTRQFFRDVRAQRARVAAGWLGLPASCVEERDRLALLLICRLVFLYFLQRRGHLCGDRGYLPGLHRRWRRRPGPGGFYGDVLVPLFFGALNTRPERRDAAARALGPLPYLNGGLFERHALERRFPELDLPDDVVAGVFDDLLERYRFTVGVGEREGAGEGPCAGESLPAGEGLAAGVGLVAGEGPVGDEAPAASDAPLDSERPAPGNGPPAGADRRAVGIDPEMLGRIFEGLMAAERRSASGTFFTPAAAVDRLVAAALEAHLCGPAFGLDAAAAARWVWDGRADGVPAARREDVARRLARLRVLDPACGSGAFLLGALARIERLRAAVGERDLAAVRRDVVARALHGVDVQGDAALLCALRLWLALAVEADAPAGRAAEPLAPRSAAGRSARRTARGGRAAAAEPATPGAATVSAAPTIAPLPNLDRRIRQGDALVDPIDLIAGGPGARAADGAGAALDAAVRRALRAIPPLAARYLSAGPESRPALQRALAEAERRLAAAWIGAVERGLHGRARELAAVAGARDLFGERPASARRAEPELAAVRARIAQAARLRAALDEAGALPFFSFGIHFPQAAVDGFDLVLSNPPWVRAHRWPATVGRLVRDRYAVCRRAGWRGGVALTGAPRGAGAQVDLSLLFLERSLRLLAPGGTLAMVLPAKALRCLYGAGARAMLLRDAELIRVEDYALDQRAIFSADAFAATVVARRGGAGPPGGSAPTVRITMVRRGVEPLRFAVPADELALLPGDPEAPWLLAPPAARAALRRMQAAAAPLGATPGLRVRRGVVTGANDVLVLRRVEAKLGGLAAVEAEGLGRARRAGRAAGTLRRFRGIIEDDAVRPLVRGADVAAWRFRIRDHVLWIHDDATAGPRTPPPRTARYLARHGRALDAGRRRAGRRPPGALRCLAPDSLGAKVAWHDLAIDLGAVAIPARVRDVTGRHAPVVPLNTVYFVPVADEAHALVLAALLNSLPVRTFARAIAERAKDAHFRFLAWTVALVPVPTDWNRAPAARRLREIAAAAHRDGTLTPAARTELDALAGAAYGLGSDDLDALAGFDRWLRGDSR